VTTRQVDGLYIGKGYLYYLPTYLLTTHKAKTIMVRLAREKLNPTEKLFANHVKHSKKFPSVFGVHLKNIRSLDYIRKILHCKDAHFVLKHLSIQINQGRQLLYTR
jgi:hypothetical protein